MIVRLRSIGPLAEALGGNHVEQEVPPGTRVGELLDLVSRGHPAVAPFLGVPGDRPVAVFRGGRRLEEGDRLEHADEIHLVVSVAGG